jgi:hypothetical protein
MWRLSPTRHNATESLFGAEAARRIIDFMSNLARFGCKIRCA